MNDTALLTTAITDYINKQLNDVFDAERDKLIERFESERDRIVAAAALRITEHMTVRQLEREIVITIAKVQKHD